MLREIGKYKLDAEVSKYPELVEFSGEELTALNPVSGVENEKIYHADDVDEFGVTWSTVIGAINSRVYKIALQNVSNIPQASEVLFGLMKISLEKDLGKSKKQFLHNRYVWEFQNRNVILDKMSREGITYINLFLTGNIL